MLKNITLAGRYYILAIITLFILGLCWRINIWIALSISMSVLIVASSIYARLILPHLSVSRKCYHSGLELEDIPIKVELKNYGKIPAICPEIEDIFPPDQIQQKEIAIPLALRSRKSCIVNYTAYCFRRRGIYKLGPITVKANDPLGLVSLSKVVPDYMEFLVYPGTLLIDHEFPRGLQKVFITSDYTKAKSANSSFYLGTREYTHRDEIKKIHWSATARTGKLMVKEFEEDVKPEVTIIIDLNKNNAMGIGQKSIIEYAVKIASSFSLTTITKGNFLQFIALGSRYHYVPFGAGNEHLTKILDSLVYIKQDGTTSFSDFLLFTKDLINYNSTLILIFTSPFIPPEQYSTIFEIYKAKMINVIAVVLDTQSFLKWHFSPIADEATADIHEAVNYLRENGIEVLPINAELNIQQQLSTHVEKISQPTEEDIIWLPSED